jgi:hypothetical protein
LDECWVVPFWAVRLEHPGRDGIEYRGYHLRGQVMKRQIREYVEIDSHLPLDEVIEELTRLRDALPAGSEAEIRMRGDDFFGRHLCVSYLRELTHEEAICEARYAEAGIYHRAEAA